MFAAERIEKIKEIMQEQKTINILTLSSLLNVSDVTIRRDLDKLEEIGFLTKTHGGAILVDEQPQESMNISVIENCEEKEKIAEISLSLIDEGDTIFLGAGSTCLMFARVLKKVKNVKIVTNNINASYELSPHIENIHLVGGEIVYNNGMLYVSGSSAINSLQGIFVNKAFLGVNGVDIRAGFTLNENSLCSLYKKVLDISKTAIVLADYTKFNKIGLYQVGNIDFPYCIVSNEKLKDSYKKYFYEKNIKLLTTFDI